MVERCNSLALERAQVHGWRDDNRVNDVDDAVAGGNIDGNYVCSVHHYSHIGRNCDGGTFHGRDVTSGDISRHHHAWHDVISEDCGQHSDVFRKEQLLEQSLGQGSKGCIGWRKDRERPFAL
ncbi:MAG: hypothetical protein RLZZ327_261, partial [Actinomycetota bacterium]